MAEVQGRVLHNIGNTTIKKWSNVTQIKFKISSLSILVIMMFVCGANSTSLHHADNDEQRNHLPRMTTQELKLNNNDSTVLKLVKEIKDTSTNTILSESSDHGYYGVPSHTSSSSEFLDQDHSVASTHTSSSTKAKDQGVSLASHISFDLNKSIRYTNLFTNNIEEETILIPNKNEYNQRKLSQLEDWAFCSSSSQCRNGCCSSRYSDDGKLKCTPVGGFKPHEGCITGEGGPAPTPTPPPVGGSGTCGGGNRGNGVCADGTCCSRVR